MSSPSPCSCTESPPTTPSSVVEVSIKEIFILLLFSILLLYSIISFLHHWNKNYRNISYLPTFTEDTGDRIKNLIHFTIIINELGVEGGIFFRTILSWSNYIFYFSTITILDSVLSLTWVEGGTLSRGESRLSRVVRVTISCRKFSAWNTLVLIETNSLSFQGSWLIFFMIDSSLILTCF